jgi:hypothetical protein
VTGFFIADLGNWARGLGISKGLQKDFFEMGQKGRMGRMRFTRPLFWRKLTGRAMRCPSRSAMSLPTDGYVGEISPGQFDFQRFPPDSVPFFQPGFVLNIYFRVCAEGWLGY